MPAKCLLIRSSTKKKEGWSHMFCWIASLLLYLPVKRPSSEFGVAALCFTLGFWIASASSLTFYFWCWRWSVSLIWIDATVTQTIDTSLNIAGLFKNTGGGGEKQTAGVWIDVKVKISQLLSWMIFEGVLSACQPPASLFPSIWDILQQPRREYMEWFAPVEFTHTVANRFTQRCVGMCVLKLNKVKYQFP